MIDSVIVSRSRHLDRKPLTKEDKRRLDVILFPSKGSYAMISAYLDESGTHEGSPSLCVSGVIYNDKLRKRLGQRWKKELERAGIRYFHAKEQAHCTGQFASKTRDEANQIYRCLLGIVKNHAQGSVTVCAVPRIFEPKCWKYSPYLICSYLCLATILSHVKIKYRCDHVVFCIEAGHEDMGKLRDVIKRQRKRDERWLAMVEDVRFVEKEDRPAIQTADILAYETFKRVSELVNPTGRAMRKSLESVIGDDDTHRLVRLDEESFNWVCRAIRLSNLP